MANWLDSGLTRAARVAVFLPALIMEAMMSTNFSAFVQSLPVSLLLAGPGMMLQALLPPDSHSSPGTEQPSTPPLRFRGSSSDDFSG